MATHLATDEVVSQARSPPKDDIHTRCKTQEGVYSITCVLDSLKNLRLSNSNSFHTNLAPNSVIKLSRPHQEGLVDLDDLACSLFCVNYGYNLCIYKANVTSKPVELLQLINSKSFEKIPTSHDFRPFPAKPKSQGLQNYKQTKDIHHYEILIGMNNGQIYLADQYSVKKIFNVDQQVEKSKVTCLKWVPINSTHFVVGYQSGFLYTYDVEMSSSFPLSPNPLSLYQVSSSSNNKRVQINNSIIYQMFKTSKGLCIYTVKLSTKTSSGQQSINPVYKWCFDANLPVNDLAFSPCSKYLSVASQDGYLRIINYENFEIKTSHRSYFGGLRCVSWSADGQYLASGGDDDMITIFSLRDDSVICRCVGHKSRINAIAFDSFVNSSGLRNDVNSIADECGNNAYSQKPQNHSSSLKDFKRRNKFNTTGSLNVISPISNHHNYEDDIESSGDKFTSEFYRLISVADDTLMCFWDLNIKELNDVKPCQMETNVINESSSNEILVIPADSASKCSEISSNGIAAKHFFPLKFGQIASKKHNKFVINGSTISNNLKSLVSHDNKGSSQMQSKIPSQKFASLSIFDQRKRDKETKRSSSAEPSKRFATVTGSEFGFKNKISPHTNLSANFNSSSAVSSNPCDRISIALGSKHCPRLSDVPLVDPLVCKKVSNDRLISLSLDADHIVMSSQDGCLFVCTRPIFAMKL